MEGDFLDVQLSLKETRRYCTEKPGLLVSTANIVKLIFNSGKYNSRGRGFKLRYTAEPAGCGGVFSAANGTVTQFPCLKNEWIIQVKERNYIRLMLDGILGRPEYRDTRFVTIFSNNTYRPKNLLKS